MSVRKQIVGVFIGCLVLFHIYACAQAFSSRKDPVPEWRKGPLIYDASPYSSQNAHRIFWPAAALTLDMYLVLAILWLKAAKRRDGRPRGNAALAALIPALSLLLSLGAGEVLTRAYIRHCMFLQYRPHPDLLWYNRPNLRNHTDATDPAPKSTTALGFRGREEIPKVKKEGEYRVFLTGDSSTFGLGVPDEATFGHVLQEQLKRLTGRDVRVINSACPGHTSYEGLFLLQQYGLALKPDLIIWAYNNDPCLDAATEKQRYSANKYVRAFNRVAYRSDLFLLFQRVVLDARHGWNAEQYRRTFRQEQAGWVKRIPFEDFKAYLEQFADIAGRNGSRIMFLRMPLNRPMCQAMPIYYTSFDDKYRDYVAELCGNRGLPFLDFESLFLSKNDPALFLPGHLFHPSIRGHGIIGEQIATWAYTNRLLQSAGPNGPGPEAAP